LRLKSPSINQLPNKINCGTLVGTVPIIIPKAKEQTPNKNRYLWIFCENMWVYQRNEKKENILLKKKKSCPIFLRQDLIRTIFNY
jgi:hypothetical protein